MKKFKIVFLDGKEMEIKALNFGAACLGARYLRIMSEGMSINSLIIDEKKCFIVRKMRRLKKDRKNNVINAG